MPLTTQQLDELKNDLLRQLDIISNDISHSDSHTMQSHGDSADLATSQWGNSIDIELAEHETNTAIEIQSALERIDEGTYGICEMSGEEIPFARLKAIPTARYTAQCQEQIEMAAAY